MCRGVVRGGRGSSGPSPRRKAEAVPCGLCGSRAMLYCQADGAYLCKQCDGHVHGANFLAGRHVRCLLCKRCQKLTGRYVMGNSTDARVSLGRSIKVNQGDNRSKAARGTPVLFL